MPEVQLLHHLIIVGTWVSSVLPQHALTLQLREASPFFYSSFLKQGIQNKEDSKSGAWPEEGG